MRRVFVPGDAVRGERVALTGEQAHYLLRVLRLGPGRRFSAVLPDGEERVAVIESAAGDEVHARLG
jgi:16S rRNA (uracil1498-N3)-methyltransferase